MSEKVKEEVEKKGLMDLLNTSLEDRIELSPDEEVLARDRKMLPSEWALYRDDESYVPAPQEMDVAEAYWHNRKYNAPVAEKMKSAKEFVKEVAGDYDGRYHDVNYVPNEVPKQEHYSPTEFGKDPDLK